MELSADFAEKIDRYQFMCINGIVDSKNKFLDLWVDVILTEKRRQMIHEQRTWHPENLPWTVQNVWSMPMVIWLRKGEEAGQMYHMD